ncbi:44100_t:CDS:2, partial [Gigaspora margarita]
KDAKNITSRLENLLTKLRWIAIFVANGRYSLMAIKLMDNHQLRLSFPIGEAKIPAKSDNISDSIFLLSLLIYIKQEIERIKFSNLEENSSLDFLKKTVYATPPMPIKLDDKKFL